MIIAIFIYLLVSASLIAFFENTKAGRRFINFIYKEVTRRK